MSLSSVTPGSRSSPAVYIPDSSSSPLLYSSSVGPVDLNRYVEQIERKREYNRKYYQNNIKPKKQHQKQELELLREKIAQLDVSDEVARYRREIALLTERNNELLNKLHQHEQESLAIKQALEMSRQRNFELMSIKVDHILPNLEGLTLPQ